MHRQPGNEENDNDDKNTSGKNLPELPNDIWSKIFSLFTRAELGRGPVLVSKKFKGFVDKNEKSFEDKFKRCFPEEYEKITRSSKYCEEWKVQDWEEKFNAVEREAYEGLTETGKALLDVLKRKDITVLQQFLKDHVVSLADLSFPPAGKAEPSYGALPQLPKIVCFRTDKVAPILWALLYGSPEACQELYSQIIIHECQDNSELRLRWAIRSGQGREEVERCYQVLSADLRKLHIDDKAKDPEQQNQQIDNLMAILYKQQIECLIEACKSGNCDAALFFFLKNKDRENNVKIINELHKKIESDAEKLALAKVYCHLIKKVPNYFSWDGVPFVSACDTGSLGAARYYLDKIEKLDLNKASATNRLPLIDACVKGGVAMVDFLCEQGANVNTVLKYDKKAPSDYNLLRVGLRDSSCSPLIAACARRDLSCVKCLVERQAEVNLQVGDLMALPISCTRNAVEIAKYLVKNKAVFTPALLDSVARNCRRPMLEFLIELGVDFRNVELDGAFERDSVCGDEPIPAILLLHEKGAVVHDPDKALRTSCRNLETDLVSFLLENYSPNVNMKVNEDEITLLEDVLNRNDIPLCCLLIRNGANTDMLTPEQIEGNGFAEAIAEAKAKSMQHGK